MDISDATTFGQHAVRVNLITEQQLREAMEDAREETGKNAPDVIFLARALERKGYLTNYQTSKLFKGDTDGYFLGGFRMLYKISSGSFGRVFRADDPRSGRVVAMKVLRRRWSEDRNKTDLFIREGKVGLTLKHPNIVEVLAINQDTSSGQYYIAMEFVEGGNLREILQIRKTLSVPESLRIMEDAASGLAYAYSRGITHRDIKLTNLLISSTGEAKLVDFGLAQMFASMAREDEQIDRTVDYAGLEKTTGVKSGDVRSDIFFLGCVLYEMLTGKPPLEMTKDKNQRMSARRFQELKALRPADLPGVPAAVFTLCESMMAFEVRRRYQTPSQMLDAIKAARRDLEGGQAGGGSAGRPQGRSLFVAESHVRMQEQLREGFKEAGFRVLLASDPVRALDRFRQMPYDALLVDAGSVGEDGLHVFERVLDEADEKGLKRAGILILAPEQAAWAERINGRANAAALVFPVGFKALRNKLRELLGD